MKVISRKTYWKDIYTKKDLTKVSWVQEKPSISLAFINQLNIDKSAKILDVAGGNSNLVDFLLAEGYTQLSVLDIAEESLQVSRERLGNQAHQINWLVNDILNFDTQEKFDVWHDRAGFHFMTTHEAIDQYKNVLNKVKPTYLIIGTFSENGPEKCSGLPIKNYSIEELKGCFIEDYKMIKSKNVNHTTPTGSIQNFNFCMFIKKG